MSTFAGWRQAQHIAARLEPRNTGVALAVLGPRRAATRAARAAEYRLQQRAKQRPGRRSECIAEFECRLLHVVELRQFELDRVDAVRGGAIAARDVTALEATIDDERVLDLRREYRFESPLQWSRAARGVPKGRRLRGPA